MSQRNAEKLVPSPEDQTALGKGPNKTQQDPNGAPSTLTREMASEKEAAHINMDFPRPTRLTEIILTIAKWNHYTILMEPKLDRTIQIFSPSPMSREDGFKVFLAALQTVGLRAVFMGPNTFKISELSSSKREV